MSQPNSIWNAAVEAYGAGDLAGAGRLGLQLLQREPRNVQLLHLLCLVAYGQGDHELHAKNLSRLLAVAPNHAPSLNALANLRREQGNLTEALELSKRAIQAAPQYANAHNTLGLCYRELDRWTDAAECFKHAIELQPDVAAVHVNLGAALQHLDKMSQALDSYRRATELSPDLVEAHEGMGHVFAYQRKRGEALRCYTRALALAPNSVHHILLVAEFEAFYGLMEESLAHVEQALKLDPQAARAHLLYGFRMQDMGNFEAAMASFRRSIELAPNQGEAYLGVVSSAKVRMEDQELIERIQALIDDGAATDADLILLHTALSKISEDLGSTGQAVWHVEEANRIAIAKNGGKPIFDRGEFAAYVDGVIETFTPEFVAERKDWAFETELPLLIIGLPRSGTTLTEQILSNHPQVSAAGEQPFWSDVNTAMQTVALAHQKTKCQEVGRAYNELLRKFGPNSRFVTDKRPDNFCFVGLIHTLFPNARFIHCRRRLVDNCLSLYMTPFRMRSPFTHSREDILFYVRQYQRLMDHWRQILPANRIHDIDYEDVVSDQEGAARRLLAFCGLEWDEACLRPEQNKRAVSTPSNWQTRQAVYTTSVDRWRRYESWLGAFQQLVPGDPK